MKRNLKTILGVALLVFYLGNSAASAKTANLYIAPAEVRLKTAAYAEAFNALAQEIDPRFYNVDGLAEYLDYGVLNAVKYVQDQIAYDPYLGVMKGPSGTISTQSGSAWDQAVLLAALINAMGGEAMLGVGKLSEEDALTLLKIGITNPARPKDGLQDIDPKTFLEKKLDRAIEDPRRNTSDVSYEDYQRAADEIAVRLVTKLKASEKSNTNGPKQKALAYALELADDYVWVRYRDTPNDPWQESHPSFKGLMIPEVEADKYVAATVPDDKLHKVKIRFYIERATNGKTATVPITRDYVRPAANLSGHQIRLGISPNSPNPDGEPSFYTPVIDGIVQDGSQSFTPLGLTFSPEDAATGPEIFRTVAKGLGNALGSLNEASGEKENTPRLTGVILNVTHIAPGGKETKTVRRLTDFREGAPEEYAKHLVSNLTLEVNVGAENGARDFRAMFKSAAILVRQLPYQKALLEKKITIDELLRHPSSQTLPSHEWFAALHLGNAFAPSMAGGRVIRTSPLVIMRRIIPNSKTGFKLVVDIQHNAVRAFTLPQPDQPPIEDMRLAVRQGVLETLIEGELIGVSGVADWTKIEDLRVLSSTDALESDPIWDAANANLKDRLVADLKDSGSIVIPNGQMQRWWKVNPESGQSLGMGKYGGSDTIEEAIMQEGIMLELIGHTVGGFFFAKGLTSGAQACAGAGGSGVFETCCMVGMSLLNGGMALGGIASGNWMSSKFGAGIGFIYGLGFDGVTGNSDTIGDAVNDGSVALCEYATG